MPKDTFMRLTEEKRQRIMRAAIGVFIENGFERAKVEDIALRSDVAKGSIYQYFADKKDLFLYCAQWGLEVFMEKLDARMHLSDMDIFFYFQDTLSKTEVLQEEHDLAVFLQIAVKEPGLMDESIKGMYNIGDIYIKKLLQNSKSKGVVRTDIDDDILTEYFAAVVERFKMRWVKRYLDFTKDNTGQQLNAVEGELTQMVELLKNGMGEPAAAQ